MALKMVILEDEVGLRDSLRDFFKSVGHTVFATARGDEALVMVEKESPHVILCDLHLEGSPITGIEVLKQTSQKHPNTKVIIMTGYGKEEGIVNVCNQYNPYMFLGKPVSIIKIQEALSEIEKNLK
ncbi:MAG: response regulator [Candidatus Omnitrophota bacterium]